MMHVYCANHVGIRWMSRCDSQLATVVRWLSIMQAFRVARNRLFNTARPNVTKIAILVTDGEANRETTATLTEANKTKETNVEVFCVGITSNVGGHTHTHTHTHARNFYAYSL